MAALFRLSVCDYQGLGAWWCCPRTPSLNQRRERLELGRLLAGIAATDGKAIEFRSLQYGVTAGKLRRALESYPGAARHGVAV